jgi:VIT1/CCC1 family predicted Fe2+/Mn2+ transporter
LYKKNCTREFYSPSQTIFKSIPFGIYLSLAFNDMELEKHYTNRCGWLRAAVLGANDGILYTTSLAIGVAAASHTHDPIVLAAFAGLVVGATSMAAGEYVSVSSQSDIETADLEREKNERDPMPEVEQKELAKLYQKRGLDKNAAKQVAVQLTKKDALATHARDELGINEMTQPKPLTAAFASAGSFISGGLLPLLAALFAPLKLMVVASIHFNRFFLHFQLSSQQRTGGQYRKAVIRICFWSTVAMAATASVGYLLA